MFARTAFPALRGATRTIPLKQNVRRYTTPAESRKSSSGLLYATILGAVVAGGAYYYYSTTANVRPLPPPEITLKGDGTWIDLPLVEIHPVTGNTKLLRFALPTENHVSGLHVASAILTKYKGPNDEKPTIRPYTPINDEDARGYLDLLVKKYDKGPMSTHLHDMNINQSLSFKGPLPKYEWAPNKHDHIALIAGGTGITPMYQLIRTIFKNPEDKTKVTLVFGNVTENDILLKRELAELENTYPQRFKAFYVLDKAPKDAGWATQGYITKELLKTVLPEPGSGNNMIFLNGFVSVIRVFDHDLKAWAKVTGPQPSWEGPETVCGPPRMYKAISGGKKSPSDQGELSGVLKELGYNKDDVYKF